MTRPTDIQTQAEARAAWVERLLSKQYEQGMSYLHRDNEWCCLGVGCDLYIDHVADASVAWDFYSEERPDGHHHGS